MYSPGAPNVPFDVHFSYLVAEGFTRPFFILGCTGPFLAQLLAGLAAVFPRGTPLHSAPEWRIVGGGSFGTGGTLRHETLDDLCNKVASGRANPLPLAVVFSEDGFLVAETVERLRSLGFTQIVLIDSTPDGPGDDLADSLDWVSLFFRNSIQVASILDFIIESSPGRWIFWCYNGEFLFFPHCETRSIADVVTFMEEERRESVATMVVDLFSDAFIEGFGEDPRQSASLDTSGYFGLQRYEGSEPLERQFDVIGGLKWRFEEHIPWQQRQVSRVSLFRAAAGLEIDGNGQFNEPEYNTISCPWHHNLTIAVASFRTARGLVHNPGSRSEIRSFLARQSAPFEWTSRQLLELGFMEPGQWF